MKNVKTYIWWGIYILIGIIIIALTIVTATYGLDPTDRDIYQMAMNLDSGTDGFGFSDFSVKDYKIRISNGQTDYVMWNGEYNKEPVVFDTLVATAQKVNDEYQVILPAYKDFSEFVQSMGTLTTASEGGESFSSGSYSRKSHAATLYHEAFHAWQFSKFEAGITKYMKQMDTSDSSPESIIVSKIDSNKKHMKSLKNELKYLYAACKAANQEDVLSWLRRALDEEALRRSGMDEKAVVAELYLEMVEGPAHYVESMAYRKLTDADTWKTEYLTEKELSGGSGKYYTIGMLKCLLLDRLEPGWQNSYALPYDISKHLEESIQKE